MSIIAASSSSKSSSGVDPTRADGMDASVTVCPGAADTTSNRKSAAGVPLVNV